MPDSAANLARFTRQGGNHGGAGYPQVRLLALVACGTRTLIDAVSGPTTSGETTYAANRAAGSAHQMPAAPTASGAAGLGGIICPVCRSALEASNRALVISRRAEVSVLPGADG